MARRKQIKRESSEYLDRMILIGVTKEEINILRRLRNGFGDTRDGGY